MLVMAYRTRSWEETQKEKANGLSLFTVSTALTLLTAASYIHDLLLLNVSPVKEVIKFQKYFHIRCFFSGKTK